MDHDSTMIVLGRSLTRATGCLARGKKENDSCTDDPTNGAAEDVGRGGWLSAHEDYPHIPK